ncbi:MAG TPA: RsmB/NOP family class I SAM-dependent RNA methyltransferase [Opitutus sp.]|nr:RsmB/NOP family class I SAM-dependent RNA methyltransferase [Opitutus sp.]
MSNETVSSRPTAWPAAARLIARWLERRERVDELLETLGGSLVGAERARCQHLVFGVVRHFGRIEAALNRLIAHPPRFSTRGVLFVAGFELIESGDKSVEEGMVAKTVHHAVEQTKRLASPAEARLVNAVTRKLAAELAVPPPPIPAPAEVLAEYFSHPEWLVRRWLTQFGAEATRALLEWNQRPAPVYARWRAAGEAPPSWMKPTQWENFHEIESGHWSKVEPLLRAGKIYLQDPATRLAVELLAPQPTEVVLDACAAPGGKSLLIADALQQGKVIAMDLPGARIERLAENLSRLPPTVGIALVQADLRESAGAMLKEHGLSQSFLAVLLDVPCSNTGVMRHRVDVKWRLQEGDFKKHPRQQLALLAAAARLVAPGGRLVYSTCSLEQEENEDVVKEFLADRHGKWTQEGQVISRPWETGHDGAAAFLLRRNARTSD